MPKNCRELYEQGLTTSGVYNICPWDTCDPNFRCVDVFCDMHTDGGGWTVSMLVIVFINIHIDCAMYQTISVWSSIICITYT